MVEGSGWPRLDDVDLAPTLGTLHLWSQVVGKVRLALTPWENHGWHVPLYLDARGFSTGLMQAPGLAAVLAFDLVDGELAMRTSLGGERRLELAGSVAQFQDGVLDLVRDAGLEVAIDPMPCELPGAVPFDRDTGERVFDVEVARRYWHAMLEAQRVFQLFRTRFTGKISPIHLFWGSFDLAVTRFSGRIAPSHPGGAPHLRDAVMREAYSREVSSAGFWPNPGGADGPSFYSYAYPVPEGFDGRRVAPAAARFDAGIGEFLLPYEAVRSSDDPDGALLEFLQSTYEAAADLAAWDRGSLEREQGVLGRPPRDF